MVVDAHTGNIETGLDGLEGMVGSQVDSRSRVHLAMGVDQLADRRPGRQPNWMCLSML